MKGGAMTEKEKGAACTTPLQAETLTDTAKIGDFSKNTKEISENLCMINTEALRADLQRLVAEAAVKKEAEADEHERQYRGDLTKDYAEPSYLFRIGGVGAVCRGEITAIKARAKQGKTTCGSIFMAVALGAEFAPVVRQEDDLKVMYIDTEQSDISACIVARRVHRMAGWDDHTNDSRFLYYTLRPMAKEERWEFIKQMIQKHRPDLLFLDGLVDLVHDFNSNTESGAMVEELTKVAASSNLAIMFCLHKNKSKEDDSMRGHLGTEAVNKSYEVVQVEKSGSVFHVSCSECRGIPWDRFSFTVDDWHTPHPVASAVCDDGQQKKIRTLRKLLTDIFGDREIMTSTQIKNEIKTRLMVNFRTAGTRLSEAVEAKIVVKRDRNYKLNATCKNNAN